MIINIPVTKAGVTHSVAFDTDKPSPEVFAYLVALGAKQVLARGMSKITKSTAGAEQVVKDTVEKNLEDVYAGKIRMTGGVKQKAVGKGEVHTDAMREARQAVKDALKADGKKVSHYAASTISELAKELIDSDPSFLERAKERVEARKAAPKPTIDVSKVAVSAAKVAAAEKKAEERKKVQAEKGEAAPKAAKPKGKGKAPAKVAPAKGQAPAHA